LATGPSTPRLIYKFKYWNYSVITSVRSVEKVYHTSDFSLTSYHPEIRDARTILIAIVPLQRSVMWQLDNYNCIIWLLDYCTHLQRRAKGIRQCIFFPYYTFNDHNFSHNYLEVNSCQILIKFRSTKAKMYAFSIFIFKYFCINIFMVFKYLWFFKPKLQSLVFKNSTIVLCFWHSKFRFVFNLWTLKIITQ
jgi:hypothetical protein